MRSNAIVILIRRTILIALFVNSFFSLCAMTGQNRGQGVKIKVEGGQTIDLYEGSYALVIGAVNYQNWRRLTGVQGDAEEVAAVLQKHGFNVEKLLDPTRESFDHAMRKFISDYGQSINNRLLIYFAGHGHTLTTVDGRSLGYIVPIDAPRGDNARFKQFGVSMDEIVEVYAKQIESKHVLFVFDSCFSGSVFATRSAGATPPAIARNTAEPVRQFITAGSEMEEVPDRSIFRDYFVSGLEGRADYDKDGFVTGSELGLYLEQKVTNDPKSSQKPQWGKISSRALNKGDFVFRIPSNTEVATTNRSRLAEMLRQAEASLRRHDYEGAISAARQALIADPNSGVAHRFLYEAYFFRNDSDRSKQAWNNARRLLESPKNAMEYEACGTVYISSDGQHAIADFSEAIRLDPKYAMAYNNRGVAYVTKNEYDRAIADFSEAIRLDPNFVFAYRNRGHVYFSMKYYDWAIVDFSEAIRLDPKFALAYNDRGGVYLSRNDYYRAIADFSEAIRFDPKFAVTYHNRAMAYRMIGRYDLAEADERVAKGLTGK
ncbi:MAG TPA: tetratricopeptide repeat protein [Blastocatellia bacterium]|nr:tetratricopeptide repeat protein [Blastocatellia bacterium]